MGNAIGVSPFQKGSAIKQRKLMINITLWLFLLPAVLFYAIFHYGAMFGVIIAFQDYNLFRGILESPWVGFRHFRAFFDSIYFVRLIRNTILLNFYGLLFGFPLTITFAILLNEVRISRLRSSIQMVSYLPNFISIVVKCSMIRLFLSPTTGILASFQRSIDVPVSNLLMDPSWFRTIFVSSGIWQTLGWSSIIFYAALSNINPELYEAASIDGANRFHKIIRISLPSILPTIIMMLLLQLGQFMNVSFEKVMLLYAPVTFETADVISTYVFRSGLINQQFSFATAVGLFNSVVTLALIVTCNTISRRSTGTSLW